RSPDRESDCTSGPRRLPPGQPRRSFPVVGKGCSDAWHRGMPHYRPFLMSSWMSPPRVSDHIRAGGIIGPGYSSNKRAAEEGTGMSSTTLRAFMLGSALFLPVAGEAQAAGFRVLHTFLDGSDGATSNARLITDRKGNLFGTALQGGDSNN